MNVITWTSSSDPNIMDYTVESGSYFTGPFSFLTTVSHSIPGPAWDTGTLRFFYNDNTSPPATWYRLQARDTFFQTSSFSTPFQPSGIPTNFQPGMTPFGIFDQDVHFQLDADRIYEFTIKKLGDPIMVVHLSATQAYTAFEEACLEYSAMVNSYQAKSSLASFLGSSTGTLSGSENKYASKNLSLELAMADAFAAEADVNSNLPQFTGSITLVPGQQLYDLPSLLSASGHFTGSGRIRIRELYHKSPLQAYRFFGTTSGLNYLNSQFRFESFTPETLFYLLPVWEDILRGMQFKTSNNVRRSNYSYATHNNKLSIFPAPGDARQLHFTFTVDANATTAPSGSAALASYNGVANLSNVPFGNIEYSKLNSISKSWIRRMAYAQSKEIEGQIRSKFTTVPIPNGDLTLNGPELISDARSEMETLRTELRDMLEETTYAKLMEREMQMAQSLNETFKQVPMGIYVGAWLLFFVGPYLI